MAGVGAIQPWNTEQPELDLPRWESIAGRSRLTNINTGGVVAS